MKWPTINTWYFALWMQPSHRFLSTWGVVMFQRKRERKKKWKNWDQMLQLRIPSNCTCGVKFSVEHALSCSKGGFPSIRHNEIRDLTTNLLTEVCSDVCIKPDLQPIDGEVLTGSSSNTQDGTRLDIAANGFWGGRFEWTFFDARVFNPHALSNRNSRLASSYRKRELQKKRQYKQSVREIEHAPFTPLVLSATASEATVFYKRLASCLPV